MRLKWRTIAPIQIIAELAGEYSTACRQGFQKTFAVPHVVLRLLVLMMINVDVTDGANAPMKHLIHTHI